MRALQAIILTITLSTAAVAGCVELDAPDTASTGVVDDLYAFLDPEHDHLDPTLHEAALNLDLLAYSTLDIDASEPRTFGELDVVGDLAVVAVLQPVGGFVTVDVSDPANPKQLAYHEAGLAYAADVKLSPDGKHAFLAVNGPFARDRVAEDPTLAPTLVESPGVLVVNVKDPANPVTETFYPLPTGGVHMLDVHVIGGETYVFNVRSSGLLGLPLSPPTGNPGATNEVEIARLGDLPDGSHALEHVASYRMPEARTPTGFIGVHDVTVVDDPDLGALMLVAGGRAGLALVDVNDPSMPKHLGSWTGHDGEYVHTVMQTFVGDTRVVVAVPEAFNGETQNQVWILDATDPAAMELVGTWRLPGGEYPFDGGYRFSTHNFNILENRIYMAHFHAGVWVLDISTPELLAAPEVVAYYMPHRDDNVGTSLGIPAIPLTWDVVPAKGKVMVADITTGFYVLEPAFEMPDALAYGTRGMDAAHAGH